MIGLRSVGEHAWPRPLASPRAAVVHVFGPRTRQNRGLFRRLKFARLNSDYFASDYAGLGKNGRSSGNDLQTSLKNARTIWQVDLGDESADLRAAPRHSMPAVQENRSRLADVQQGERKVRQGDGHRSVWSKRLRPFRVRVRLGVHFCPTLAPFWHQHWSKNRPKGRQKQRSKC